MNDNLDHLYKAVESGNVSRICELLEKNPYLIKTKLNNGGNLLHLAAQYQNIKSVKVLLKYGIQTTTKDLMGYTPIDISYFKGEYHNGAFTKTCLNINYEIERYNAIKNKTLIQFNIVKFIRRVRKIIYKISVFFRGPESLQRGIISYKRKYRQLKIALKKRKVA
ncbi:MAG: ankyrin repeat domain-containing protein [Syntrophaceae bacterium]|nr:ankyrin repeat domain-containing protein [Syntrophaceae bacterium]